ncbi:MAG: hypothetical protein IPK83_10050 [Planctomycetes bacterium]|nr:hypothetical protein [Planctomycetota bacterium]
MEVSLPQVAPIIKREKSLYEGNPFEPRSPQEWEETVTQRWSMEVYVIRSATMTWLRENWFLPLSDLEKDACFIHIQGLKGSYCKYAADRAAECDCRFDMGEGERLAQRKAVTDYIAGEIDKFHAEFIAWVAGLEANPKTTQTNISVNQLGDFTFKTTELRNMIGGVSADTLASIIKDSGIRPSKPGERNRLFSEDETKKILHRATSWNSQHVRNAAANAIAKLSGN